MKYNPMRGLLKYVNLDNGVYVDVYENSVIFRNSTTEEGWEYDYQELYELTKEDYFNVAKLKRGIK